MKYVYLELMGGLGNQLFQIAAVYAHAKDHQLQMAIPRYETSNGGRRTYWKQLPKLDAIIQDKRLEDIKPYIKYKQKSFHHRRIPVPKDNWSIFLKGYFQSEKFFLKYKMELLDLITLSPADELYIKTKYHSIIKPDTGVIHIRRTDCLPPHKQLTHPIPSSQYYLNGMAYLKTNHGVKSWVIFSDDTEWVSQQEMYQLDNMVIIKDELDYLELFLMSHFSYFVIPNSTFSWWGAWLSRNEQKVVITPANWFGSRGPKDFYDIYCPGWIVAADNNI